jgi:hypothetical protein
MPLPGRAQDGGHQQDRAEVDHARRRERVHLSLRVRLVDRCFGQQRHDDELQADQRAADEPTIT